MITYENTVGRLLETRWVQPISMQELLERGSGFYALIESGRNWVLCCDLRPLKILAPDVADYMVNVFRRNNPNIVRSAFALNQNGVLSLQLERMIRAGNNPNRQVFYDVALLQGWLGEELASAERDRLANFLA